GVLSADEGRQVDGGLERVAARLETGEPFEGAPDEDVHSLVERLLYEEIGDVAGKLHTGRSRNDQVATDFRLWGMGAGRDLAYACALVGAHLSRLGEDLMLFTSLEFGFVRLADGYSTGSSLMPQKRNPDVAELGRGKAGRLTGNLMALLTLVKGLPTGYNR